MQSIEFESKISDGVIQLPRDFRQWEKKSVRVIVLENEPAPLRSTTRRTPHPAIAGKGKTIGDLVSPVVDECEWECLK